MLPLRGESTLMNMLVIGLAAGGVVVVFLVAQAYIPNPATITPSAATIDAGQPLSITLTWGGGSAPYAASLYQSSTSTCTTSSPPVPGGTKVGGSTPSFTFTVQTNSTSYYCGIVFDPKESSSISAAAKVTVNPTLGAPAITLLPIAIDAGQTAKLTASITWAGGTAPYTVNVFTGSSPTCAADKTLVAVKGNLTSQAGALTFNSASTSSYYCATVKDASYVPHTTSSPTVAFTINLKPTAVIAPLIPTIDSGQSVALVATATLGTPPYQYQWYNGNTCAAGSIIAGANAATYNAHPTSTQDFSVQVSDSSPGSPAATYCASEEVDVDPAFTGTAVTVYVPPVTLDYSQTVAVTVSWNASAGTGPYRVQLTTSSSPACLATTVFGAPFGGQTGPTSVLTVTPTNSRYICATVFDTAFLPESASSTVGAAVTLNGALDPLSFTLSPAAIDSGQSATVTATFTFTGGSSTYSVTLLTSCDTSPHIVPVVTGTNPRNGLTSNTVTFKFAAPTSQKNYCASVTDSATTPVTNNSATVKFLVNPVLSAVLTPASPAVDLGQSITLKVTAAAGTRPFNYKWYAGVLDCSSGLVTGQTNSTYTPTPTVTTKYSVLVGDASTGTPVDTVCAGVTAVVKPALVAPVLVITPSAYDTGQSMVLTANATWLGGSSTYTLQLVSGTSTTCTADTTSVRFIIGSNPQAGIAALTFKNTFSSPSASTYYCAKVTDSATVPQVLYSTAVQVVVNPALGVPTLTLSPPSVDSGQSAIITATVNWAGGTSAFTVTLNSGSSPTCASDTTTVGAYSGTNPETGVPASPATITFVAPSASTFYCATVKDGSPIPETQTSTAVTLTINPALSATITPSAPALDIGQSVTITLTTNPTGGAAPYFYQWSTGLTCSSPIGGQTAYTYTTGTISSPASYSVRVTDSSPGTPAASYCAHVTVGANPALGVALALTPPSIISGSTTVTATITWSGGTSPYSVTLFTGFSSTCTADTTVTGSKTNIVGSTTTISFTSPVISQFYCATVTDSAVSPASATSPPASFTVNPSITLTLSPSAIDVGQTTNVVATITWSGGVPTYTVTLMSGTSPTCTSDTTTVGAISGGPNPKSGVGGTSTSFTFVSPASLTYYCAAVIDSSSSPQSSVSPAVPFTINPILSATIAPPSPAMDLSQSTTVTLTAVPVGGTAPYFYQWSNGGTCSSPIAGQTASTYSTGMLAVNTTFSVRVTDGSVGTPAAFYCASNKVIVNPALVVHLYLTPSAIDLGQTTTLTAKANWTGGTYPFTITLYSGFSSSCASDTTVVTFSTLVVPGWLNPKTNIVATSISWSFPSPSLTTYYCAVVTDSATAPVIQSSPATLFTVNLVIAAGISPPAPIIDSGQSILLTALPSHGTPAYSYKWSTGLTCSSFIPLATASTFLAGPLGSTGTFSVQVADSSPGTPADVVCVGVTVTVNAALTATVSPPSPSIDSGQSILLTAVPHGGTPSFGYQWYSGVSCVTAIALQTSSTFSTGTLTSSTLYSVRITDGAAGSPPASACANVLVTVNPTFTGTLVTIAPAAATLDRGQFVTLTVSWTSAGTSTYSVVLTTSASSSCPNPSPTGFSQTGIAGTSTTFTDVPLVSTYYCATVTDSAVTPQSASTTAAASITVINPMTTPTITISPNMIDTGQTATVTAQITWSAGLAPYSVTLRSGVSPNCASDVTVVAGTSPVNPKSPATSPLTFQLPAPGVSTYFCAAVTDSVTFPATVLSPTVLFTVNAAVSATVSPPAPAIDSGQHLTLTAVPSGGTTPYHYQWYNGSLCGSAISPSQTGIAYTTPTLTSTNVLSVLVSDSSVGSPASNFCAAVTVTVDPPLTATILPASVHIDVGQYISLTASPIGGSGPFIYQWYSGASCVTKIIGQISSVFTTPTLFSTTTYSVRVNDSSPGLPVQTYCTSRTVNVVSPGISAAAITPSGPIIDNGTSVLLTAHPSGGYVPYTYQWYTGAGCTSPIGGATASTYLASPLSTTTYYYGAGDSTNGSPAAFACSPGDTVTVYPTLVASAITPASPSIDLGQSILLTSHAAGGAPTVTYQWYDDGTCTSLIAGTATTKSVSPGVTTIYSYKVTDGIAVSVCSPGDTVTVNSALVAPVIKVNSTAISSGGTIRLNTTGFSGGTSTYTCQWRDQVNGSGYVDLGSSFACTASTFYAVNVLIVPVGTWSFELQVTDSAYSPVTVTSNVKTVTVA